MTHVLLILLAIPLVYASSGRCPEGFPLYFKRTPTARNNHTSDWCMAVIEMEEMGNRDRARSLCIHINASLTIPENRKEYDAIANFVRENNVSAPHTIDGQVSPHCKAEIYKSLKANKDFNATTEKGRCNIKNQLFNFDDVNTDPTFILSSFYDVPSSYMYHQNGQGPVFRNMGDCATLVETHNTRKNDTGIDRASLAYCVGEKSTKTYLASESSANEKIESVICGRRPL